MTSIEEYRRRIRVLAATGKHGELEDLANDLVTRLERRRQQVQHLEARSLPGPDHVHDMELRLYHSENLLFRCTHPGCRATVDRKPTQAEIDWMAIDSAEEDGDWTHRPATLTQIVVSQ